MRNLLLIIAIILFAIPCNAQLSKDSRVIKEAVPEGYAAIAMQAVENWGTDEEKVFHEINLQTTALCRVMEMLSSGEEALSYDEKNVLDFALKEFTHKGYKKQNRKLMKAGKIFECHVDWQLVFALLKMKTYL